MKALVNYKICDNAPECSGIAVCPIKAMHYNLEAEKVLVSDNCTNCGLCEKECPVGAIVCSQTELEYEQNKQMIIDDQRMIKDLFVDRYGAAPLNEFFMISEQDLPKKLTSDLTLIELYEEDTINCLLKSIPIKEITEQIAGVVRYYNFVPSAQFKKEFAITELPAMLIFKNKKLLGMVKGYYSIDQENDFINQIKAIIAKDHR